MSTAKGQTMESDTLKKVILEGVDSLIRAFVQLEEIVVSQRVLVEDLESRVKDLERRVPEDWER